MLDKIDEAALVLVRDFLLALGALVFELDDEALVQERHGLQTLKHSAGNELDALGLEDGGVGIERDRRASLTTPLRRVADDGHLALRLATIEVGLLVSLAGSVNLHDKLG